MTKWGNRFTEEDVNRINNMRKTPDSFHNLTHVPVKNKYHAVKTVVDDITFDSKKEAKYYCELKLRRLLGEIKYFHRQVRFDLPGNTAYRVDFQVVYPDGHIQYVDVKGRRLKEYIKNKKQVEFLYPVIIDEV